MSQIISLDAIRELAGDFIRQGGIVVAPTPHASGRVFYTPTHASERKKIVLSGKTKAANTIKEFVFPRREQIYSFQRKQNDVEVASAPEWKTPQLILGCRPCEAASLPILDKVFAWDYQDRFYQSRRAMTTVVAMACAESDSDCFCSAVGGAPDNTSGSDALLFDLGDGNFEVRVLTDKGKKLFQGKTSKSSKTGQACELPPVTFKPEKAKAWIDAHFDDPFWAKNTLRCVGCGACTYMCPTCHCFDIVDEGSFSKGERVKNWDFCQSALFTLHASGHNPRPDQGARQRQRMSHKFSIYPEKFGATLCTGCGNCARCCPTGLGVKPLLEKIEKEVDEDALKK